MKVISWRRQDWRATVDFFGRVAKQLKEINLKGKSLQKRNSRQKRFVFSYIWCCSWAEIHHSKPQLLSFVQSTSVFPPTEAKSDCERDYSTASNAMLTTQADVRMSTTKKSANSAKVISSLCTPVDSSVVNNMNPSHLPTSLLPTVFLNSFLHAQWCFEKNDEVTSEVVSLPSLIVSC